MSTPSLLRLAEYEALSGVALSGRVLDLGGEKDAEYLSYFRGSFTVAALNLDPAARPDVVHDLERPFPIPDGHYDHALLINVLEHVFDYRQLLAEAARIVKPGGSVIIVVPFLLPIHPSPHDYWRFTGEALKKECEALGLSGITVTSLGGGAFAARYLFLDRLMPASIRSFSHYTFRHLASAADRMFSRLARGLGKRYAPADYALGYLVVAHRP